MEKEYKPTWDYFELLLFILGWLGLFLFLMALIFAHHVGLISALKVSLGYWVFIVIIFISIFFINMLYLLLQKTLQFIKRVKNTE
ncbi:MAG: hypothetical protein KAV45_02745 [Calditrichia bacterium]|jgi:hypothetical protein|nr:hypothetical protein [Calditrichia bacterium]